MTKPINKTVLFSKIRTYNKVKEIEAYLETGSWQNISLTLRKYPYANEGWSILHCYYGVGENGMPRKVEDTLENPEISLKSAKAKACEILARALGVEANGQIVFKTA